MIYIKIFANHHFIPCDMLQKKLTEVNFAKIATKA